VKKEIILGQLRELLNIIGAGLLVWGIGNESLWESVGGALLSLMTLIWVIRSKDGFEIIFSALRKVIGALGGLMIVTEWMDPEKVSAITAVLVSVIPFVWSLYSNGDGASKGGKLPMWILIFALGALFLPSCGWPAKGGIFIFDADSGAKGGIELGGDGARVYGKIYDAETGELIGGGDVVFERPVDVSSGK